MPRAIGEGGASGGWPISAPPEAGLEGELVETAELLVTADRRDRSVRRDVAAVREEGARRARAAAVEEMREAADDAYSSSLVRGCVGISSSVVQAAASVAGASGGGGDSGGEASGGSATAGGGSTSGSGSSGEWAAAGALAAGVEKAVYEFEPYRAEAEDHRIDGTERSDEARAEEAAAGRLGQDAEAARGARRATVEAFGRATELLAQGAVIALGRGSG